MKINTYLKKIRFVKIPFIKKQIKFILKIYVKSRRRNLLNALNSSILRLLFRFKTIVQLFYYLSKNTNLEEVNEFWIIYIGFINKKNYFPFIKLDSYISNNPFIVSNLINLPFDSESCQMIYIKHFFEYFLRKRYNKIIKSWKKRLIPGGILKIQLNTKKNKKEIEKLINILEKNHFFIKNIDKEDLIINGTILITAVKQKSINYKSVSVPFSKIKDIYLVINQNKEYFSNIYRLCILGFESKKIQDYLNYLNIHISHIEIFDTIESLKNISDNYFDAAIIANFFEYNNYSKDLEIFALVRKVLKPNAYVLAIVPEKKKYYSRETTQLFEKGIFVKKLDENNIAFKWINLSSSFKLIQILIENRNNFPLTNNGIKVALLGVYSLRYTFLSNARWDSQARAFQKLGYDINILELEDNSFEYVFKHMMNFKPDILWIGGKLGYDFLKKYADFFKNSEIKIVYWLWDIITPIKFDFRGIIDYMFITSKGEIPLYKKTYNLDKVYYVPVAIMPEIIHRNKFIKEKYDVGFAGQLSRNNPFYKERTKYLDLIRKHFNVKIFKNIYNDIPEYYSQCKIVYGATPFFKDLELYASNREYIALASGSCYITNYFKGLERLAENEKHILWFHNEQELITLLNKYINEEELREKIRQNAEKLATEKHNYLIRIQNMLDIVNGKTEEFYGFIK